MSDVFDQIAPDASGQQGVQPDIFDKVAAQQQVPAPNLGDAANYAYHNVYGPAMSFVNAGLLGIPKALTKAVTDKYAPGGAEMVYPKPTDNIGNTADVAANVAGGLMGSGKLLGAGVKGISSMLAARKAAAVAKEAGLADSALQGTKAYTDAAGKAIRDWHDTTGTNIQAPTDDVLGALKKLPDGDVQSILKNNTSGIVDVQGNPILNLKDVYNIRQDVQKLVDPQAVNAARQLQNVIKDTGGEPIKGLIKNYEDTRGLTSDLTDAMVNRNGNTVVNPVTRMLKQNDPAVMDRLNTLKQQVPQVNDLVSHMGAAERSAAIKKLTLRVGKKMAEIGLEGTVIGKVLGAAKE